MKLAEIIKNYTLEDAQFSLSYIGLGFEENDGVEALKSQILDYALDVNNFKKILSVLPEYSYNRLVNDKVYEVTLESDIKYYNDLKIYSLGFGTSTIYVCDEFVEFLNNIDIKEVNKYREKQMWIYECATFANTFYAAYPFKILKEVIQTNTKIKISNTELKKRVLDLPVSIGCRYFEEQDTIVNDSYSEKLEEILKYQESKPFYIPKYKEIVEYFNNGYINNMQYDILSNYNKYLKDQYGTNAHILIFNTIATSYRVDESIIGEFYDSNKFDNSKVFAELIEVMKRVTNNTRNVYNRGFTTFEILSRKAN